MAQMRHFGGPHGALCHFGTIFLFIFYFNFSYFSLQIFPINFCPLLLWQILSTLFYNKKGNNDRSRRTEFYGGQESIQGKVNG
jgi:hypothetical protein